ncbi:two-component regulator propeller domain-containing protein [Pedobacter nutrimenti]|uniref:two-component regulator propeller domain-containing protein n=1 Tax=Pedobacter nutrimenti TaxID=1241337 RepID=UPI0029310FF3|nr:two-component regulator propeller domain-containing protein [Pedobacter nutrimenti]
MKFSHLTVDEGLSHTDANYIRQDKLGYIWIGTNFGLDRYDGYTIKRFYNTNIPEYNAFRNRVYNIFVSSQNEIWIAGQDGIQRFNTATEKYTDFKSNTKLNANNTNTKLYKPNSDQLILLNKGEFKVFTIKREQLIEKQLDYPKGANLTDMLADNSGNLWFSSDKGIWVADSKYHFRKLVTPSEEKELKSSKIYLDHRRNILLVSGQKVLQLHSDNNGNILKNEKYYLRKQVLLPKGSYIADIVQDKNENYWVSTDAGLFCLDANLQIIRTTTSTSAVSSLNTNFLDKLFIDRSGCLWVCTSGGGVNFCDLNAKKFNTIQHNPEIPNTLSGNSVRSILEDKNQILWIGTNANGLNSYNFSTKKFTFYTTSSGSIKLKSNEISSLAIDKSNNLWIGSSRGIDILGADRKNLLKPSGNQAFPVDNIDALTLDYYGNMWFGSHSLGLGCISYDNQTNYKVNYHGDGYFIWANQNRPEIFVSTTNGLRRLLIDKQGNILKSFNYHTRRSANGLSSNYTYPICQQNDTTYWIGTIGGGLNSLNLKKNDTYEIKKYGQEYGIFNDVESMEIDNSGNIWMGGNGLECFNPRTKKLIRYEKNDGLQGNSFKVGASFKDKNGSLYFAGINGLNYFDPDLIKQNNISAHPVLTNLEINNKQVEVGSTGSLEKMISYCNNLQLSYLENNFKISFSSMHYANPLQCKYRYKLVGFDQNWKYTDGKNPNASYSNLDYQDYTFVLEASNNDGIWSKDQATVQITVVPPWWKSTTAKAIYIIMSISGLAGIYIYQARWYSLKGKFAIRDIEEQKREEMHLQREHLYQQQLRFFTNLSHEFRTPLSLILGPLEHLIKENKIAAINQSYKVMHRNVVRLINLINELMNFRKIADSVIKLQVEPVDTSKFIKDIADEFGNLTINKGIAFSVIESSQATTALFDVQIVEKIIFNLLNNSFKYTNSGGEIVMEVFSDWQDFKPSFDQEISLLNEYQADQYIYLRVADSGIGISKESIDQIFDRYYRVNNDHLGSGVGLALVKSLTQLHKGNIYLYSESGKGTEIIIALPLQAHNYLATEKKSTQSTPATSWLEKVDPSVSLPFDEMAITNQQDSALFQKQQIVLVEDNDELRAFLKNILQQYYHIYEAANGKEGLELAILKIPDLIISDVMMPIMNGIELCHHIKETFETSHIPFLILSAIDDLEAQIKGVQSGADYYFAKPLSTDLLLLTIHNLFEQRKKLQLKYSKDYYADATELVYSERDKVFIGKLLELVEANISDPKLDVDYLCQRLNISRTKLYQKIKGISDLSVGEFIRNIRLKQAVYIMTHEDVTLSQVADRIGLQSISYFSRAFKKEFGKSPSQFLQELKQKNPSKGK